MIERFKSRPTLAALATAAITALGVGGVAVAQSSGGAEQQAQKQDENGADDATEKADGNEKADDGPGGQAIRTPSTRSSRERGGPASLPGLVALLPAGYDRSL